MRWVGAGLSNTIPDINASHSHSRNCTLYTSYCIIYAYELHTQLMVIRCSGVVCRDVVCAYATCRVTAGEALTELGNNGMNPVKLLEFRTFLWFGLDIGMISNWKVTLYDHSYKFF